ncbi:hypothetical protein [Shewanella frigidimarina]|uniref:hypothetical protein n=1 Tax=Shewanella frigidimarina TaxID=56812 RepID=UPI000ACE1804
MLTIGKKRYFKWPSLWAKSLSICALLLSFFHASVVFATEMLPPTTETLSVKSALFSEQADFLVTLPNSYTKQTDKRYVVLFDLHPRSHCI